MKSPFRTLAAGAFVVAACALVLATFALANLTEGRAAMLESDAAFNAGDVRAATAQARRAATAYVPGAAHVAEAEARLRAIAAGAEAAGKPELSREAWQALRASAIEQRTLASGQSERLRRADESLARLSAPEARGAEIGVAAGLGSVREPGPLVAWPGLVGLAGLSLAFALAALRWQKTGAG